jgi:type IX secretion system substrate protein
MQSKPRNLTNTKTKTMKTKLLILFLTLSVQSFAQINPVENATWAHGYENMHNLFELKWDEPLQPHNNLLGYNIYRNNELYRFQTETSLYHLYVDLYGYVENCSEDFLMYGEGEGFDIHVTAVYEGQVESDYLQTFHDDGLLLVTAGFANEKAVLYPNPTKGILNIGNKNLKNIVVYDVSGKIIKAFAPESQIDLSSLSKGLYIIKLFGERETIVDKIVID